MENELMHYGIKGQKWGIRRYQNFDGTYTQEGMRRYNISKEKYDKAHAELMKARAARKAGTINPNDYAKVAKAHASAKQDLKWKYQQLKRDKLGDKGKALYNSGHTITGNSTKQWVALAIAGVAGKTATEFYNEGLRQNGRIAGAISLGALGVSGVLAARNAVQARQLRAYYGHSRPHG